jgi:hypothetical protein
MWVVTTTDGQRYEYDDYETAFLAARTQFGWENYSINEEKETDDESI